MAWSASGTSAAADTITLEAYRARLVEARALAAQGRNDAARELLRRTDAIRVGAELVAIDDRALADRIGRADALADVDRRIAVTERALLRPIDPAAADARLHAMLAARRDASEVGSFTALFIALATRIWELIGRPTPSVLYPAQILIGIALGLVLLVILVRGVRERLRVAVELPEARAARRDEPAERAREAADALARGDVRGAIHAYYRYALAALAAREALAYDPALTDRELLLRAAAVPHADALRDLVALNERVWFGLREPAAPDAQRARELAERVAR